MADLSARVAVYCDVNVLVDAIIYWSQDNRDSPADMHVEGYGFRRMGAASAVLTALDTRLPIGSRTACLVTGRHCLTQMHRVLLNQFRFDIDIVNSWTERVVRLACRDGGRVIQVERHVVGESGDTEDWALVAEAIECDADLLVTSDNRLITERTKVGGRPVALRPIDFLERAGIAASPVQHLAPWRLGDG